MTTIYLIRHGEAEGNAYRRIHGQYDSLLTANGFKQVEALSRRFQDIPIDVCYSSDLTRTSLTARSIYVPKGLPLHRDPAFREVNLGRWEDTPFGYLETFEGQAMKTFNQDPPHWFMEGAETFEAYTSRFIGKLQQISEENQGKTIAVFCHGCVLRGVLSKLFFNCAFDSIPYCDNTAVSKLFWEDGTFTYEFLNDSSHLSPEISTFARQQWWRKGDKADFNIWFKPLDTLPDGLPAPDPSWASWLAMQKESPVGLLSIHHGIVEGIHLLSQHRGKLLEDQFLGQAASCLRKEGYTLLSVRKNQVDTPELLSRYGFKEQGDLAVLSLDTGSFDWA